MLQVSSWLDDWESEATQAREAMAAASADSYKFAENNPFLSVSPLLLHNSCLAVARKTCCLTSSFIPGISYAVLYC